MRRKILIAVKTYPTLTLRHQEIVCTAGFLEDGTWIRLYPIRFRYIKEQFKKYQWIEAEVAKHRHDSRPESYTLTSPIRPGPLMGTDDGWRERKQVVLAQGFTDMCSLKDVDENDSSLAIIKPDRIVDFYWEKTDRQWDKKLLAYMMQNQLFEGRSKPLEKIPYYFKYRFFCLTRQCKGHDLMIEDWETMQLFRKMRDKYGENEGLMKVKQRFFDMMCSDKRDTYFFAGTHYRWKTWMILGVFYPPKSG